MRRLAVFSVLVLLPTMPACAQEQFAEIYKLTESGAWPGGEIDQAVAFSAARDSIDPKRWIVERVRKDIDTCGARNAQGRCAKTEVRIHDWIDSDRCPAVVPALARLAQIQVPSFAGARNIHSLWSDHATHLRIEGTPVPVGSTVDARVNMTITRISIEEQIGPFHQWWKETDVALKPCWREAAPGFGGETVVGRLRFAR